MFPLAISKFATVQAELKTCDKEDGLTSVSAAWEQGASTRRVPPVAKVMRLRGPTGKAELGLKGVSLDLLVHLPQNQSLPALLHCAFRLLF